MPSSNWQACLSGWICAPCSKSEGASVQIHLNVRESRGLQPVRESSRIDDYHGVPEMDQSEHAAIAAVGPGEYASRPKHARDLSEHAVLERSRRNIVKHGEVNVSID